MLRYHRIFGIEPWQNHLYNDSNCLMLLLIQPSTLLPTPLLLPLFFFLFFVKKGGLAEGWGRWSGGGYITLEYVTIVAIIT